jgi:hypothetical protein
MPWPWRRRARRRTSGKHDIVGLPRQVQSQQKTLIDTSSELYELGIEMKHSDIMCRI